MTDTRASQATPARRAAREIRTVRAARRRSIFADRQFYFDLVLILLFVIPGTIAILAVAPAPVQPYGPVQPMVPGLVFAPGVVGAVVFTLLTVWNSRDLRGIEAIRATISSDPGTPSNMQVAGTSPQSLSGRWIFDKNAVTRVLKVVNVLGKSGADREPVYELTLEDQADGFNRARPRTRYIADGEMFTLASADQVHQWVSAAYIGDGKESRGRKLLWRGAFIFFAAAIVIGCGFAVANGASATCFGFVYTALLTPLVLLRAADGLELLNGRDVRADRTKWAINQYAQTLLVQK